LCCRWSRKYPLRSLLRSACGVEMPPDDRLHLGQVLLEPPGTSLFVLIILVIDEPSGSNAALNISPVSMDWTKRHPRSRWPAPRRPWRIPGSAAPQAFVLKISRGFMCLSGSREAARVPQNAIARHANRVVSQVQPYARWRWATWRSARRRTEIARRCIC